MTVRKVSKSKPPPSCACSPSRENGRVKFSQGIFGGSAAFAAAAARAAAGQIRLFFLSASFASASCADFPRHFL